MQFFLHKLLISSMDIFDIYPKNVSKNHSAYSRTIDTQKKIAQSEI